MTDASGMSANGTIKLDGVLLKTTSDLAQFSNLARFQPKILQGDPTKDDNDLLSSIQSSDFSGGSGAFDLKEGTDSQRYAFSTLATRFPNMLTKPPYVGENSAGGIEGSGDKRILGEYWNATDGTFWVAWRAGSNLLTTKVDPTDITHGLDGLSAATYNFTLTLGTDVRKGVSYAGTDNIEYLYIPAGNGGYYWVGDPAVDPDRHASNTYKFAQFANWDNKLIGVTTGGRLYYATDTDPVTHLPNWTAYDLTFRLSKSYSVRGLINYFDRGDRPCLFILTDRDVWQFDPDGPEIFRLDFGWPSHPRHAMASCVWNGEFYISIGMGVFRYEGGTFVPMGLDRDSGLPPAYQGYIIDMIPAYNSMYAIVQSANRDPNMDGGRSSIHEWTSMGWHCIWDDDQSDLPDASLHTAKTMTGGIVTQSGGVYTLIFSTAGSDDHIYCMALSEEFANPRAGIRNEQVFGSGQYYYLDFGKTDNDMGGYTKIANSWTIWTEEPIAQPPAMRDDIILQCKIDDDAEWQTIAEYPHCAPGEHVYEFGDTLDDFEDMKSGTPYVNIQRRLILKRQSSYNADKPTVITNQVFTYLKTVRGAKSFQFSIDLTAGSLDSQYDYDGLIDWLDTMIEARRFISLVVGKKAYRVFLGQESGAVSTGDVGMGQYQISVVTINPDL